MKPLDLRALEQPPQPPSYLVPQLIERQAVTILSGDTGTAKSIIAKSLAVAIVQGEPWLGRPVEQGGVVYIDEENPRRIVVDRLRALGARSSDSQRLAYFNREGVRLGTGHWAERLRAVVRDLGPALVVIDTAMATCAVEALDNTAVVGLFTGVLRPLASDHDLAVLVLHHERKPGAGERRSAGYAMMGARQWAGQADVHMAVELASNPYEVEEAPEGHRRERFRVRLRVPKLRDSGDRERVERIVVESDRTPERALRWLTVRSEGAIDSAQRAPRDHELAGRIVEAVRTSGEASTGEIADAVGESADGGTFKRALNAAVEDGRLVKPARGRYAMAMGPA